MERNETEAVLQMVTDKMMSMKNNGMQEVFPVSLIDMNCWEWPQGIGIYGLYKHYERCKDPALLRFLTDWYDSRLSEGISEKNVNTTSPMLTLTYVYEIARKPEYLTLITQWAQWIMDEKNGLIRTQDDCLQHMITGNPNSNEILIDTLFMALLFLARAGALLGRQDYVDEANFQILNHIKYLYDKQNRLFYHGWNFGRNNNYGKVHWARGNAWYTLGIMELLEIEPNLDPAIKRYLVNIFKQQTARLKSLQDEKSGLWHTVLDDDTSYIETSAGVAFLCGIMKGIRLGILNKDEYASVIKQGTTGSFTFIDDAGILKQVSYGTPIGEDADFYKNIICCPMTYGQALAILMLEELLRQ